MHSFSHTFRRRLGHTLMELVVALVASAALMAGLGAVMMIARQTALTPSAAERRTLAAHVVNSMADELRYATLIIQRTPRILEFIVADRNADGVADKIRYEWSGTLDDPLYKTVNSGAPVVVAHNVQQFQLDYTTTAQVTSVQTTIDSAESALASWGGTGSLSETISIANWVAQHIDPQSFPASIGSISKNSAIGWNATRVTFQAGNSAAMAVELRETGDFNGPTSQVLGRVSLPSANSNSANFADIVKYLLFTRKYSLVFRPDSAANVSLSSRISTGARTAFRTGDLSATWSVAPDRQVFCTLYGTYSAPGASHSVTRNYVSCVRVLLQTGEASHSRVDAGIPLDNLPEVLSAYWRADFNSNPTTTNGNGDNVADWVQTAGTFDPLTLVSGLWRTGSTIETRPLCDFATVTTIDVRCQNTTPGGNGAVLRINADRQSGQYAPLLVYVQLQADGSQTLTLNGKSSDANTTQIFTRRRLSSDPIRYQLTILPQSDVVSLRINDEFQGAFIYPTYAPSTNSNRFVTLYEDISQAEFDYVDIRVAN